MNPFVVDVGDDDFESVVMQGSQTQPVLVDFWADWCAPCKQIAPILESLAEEYKGAFILAKVDTEAHQMLASQVGVRSLPTVLLVVNGQVADHFMGALPEGEIRAFLNKHVQAPTLSPLEVAREQIDANDLDAAIATLNAIVEQDSENHEAFLEMAAALNLRGDNDDAAAIIERLPADYVNHPTAMRIKAQAALHALIDDAPDLATCQAQFEANPSDPENSYLLAAREAQAGQLDSAIERLLAMVMHHRDHRDDGARKMLIQLFDLLGKDHPNVRAGRRRLAMALN